MTFKSSDWLVSTWDAGQSNIVTWSKDNVRFNADGSASFILSEAPAGSPRPYLGGEIQSYEVGTTGTWSWTAQAPNMVDGAVFGMFTYQEDWRNDPWLEFDFEFVGADTTKVQLNIHMEDANGNHIMLADSKGGPIIVDLGFDASERAALYEITVTDTSATFRIDGKVVGTFDASDMPGGVWYTGPMKSLVDLWAVAPAQEAWAGEWVYPGTPLVATVETYEIRQGEYTSSFGGTDPVLADDTVDTSNGDDTDNVFNGTDADDLYDGRGGNDVLYGNNGNDTLRGGTGADRLYGGAGNDALDGGDDADNIFLDAGNDVLDGGAGSDWVRVDGTVGAAIDLGLTSAQATGYGTDTLRNIENASGGSGSDRLTGNGGNNELRGNGGNDTLSGGAGDDRLLGGDGDDIVTLDAGNDMIDGGTGIDWLHAHISIAVKIDLALTSGQATGQGTDTIAGIENVSGGSAADSLYGNGIANHLKGNGGDDYLYGRGGNDVLDGGAGNDRLFGGSGIDRLFGGSGKDTMTGGSGADVFVFTSASDSAVGKNRDVIRDFERGVDDIDLSGIDANAGVSGDQGFLFSGMSAGAHSVWYAKSGKNIIVSGDKDGDGKADFQINLIGESGISETDFVF